MKFILWISIICTVCISCHQQENKPHLDLKDYSLRKVKLLNYCGTVSIYLPKTIDTSFQFRDRGDNACADEMYFRSASRKYSIRTQSNSFPIPSEPDSLYQMTINQKVVCLEGKTLNWDSNSLFSQSRKVQMIYGRGAKGKFYFRIINGHKYLIGVIGSNYWNKHPNNAYEEVYALTFINKQIVNFECVAYKKDTTGFVAEANKWLQTIQIDPDTSITNADISNDMKQRGIEYITYGTYMKYSPENFEARIRKMDRNCLLNIDKDEWPEKDGSNLTFTTDTVNDTFYKNNKPLIDSIPDIILNSADTSFGEPDPQKRHVVFLQIKIKGKVKTFHFNEEEAELPKAVRRYTELIKGYES